MAEDFAIELSGVKKVYDDVVAVQRFDVGIRKGEFFSLLGPSGCGKTTTLRMIAGLEEPTEGAILLEGRDVSRVPPYRRNVHTVFQDYALFPHMNVGKNIFFPLKMRGISKADAQARIQRVLRLVNMEGYRRRPLGAMDFKLRVAMQKMLKDIQRKVGITFIYVTHDQTEALTMSDRIAVMKGGYVHQIGTPDEIYNSPATAFVASFIGDMNFLHGRLVSSDGSGCSVDVNGRALKAARAACFAGAEAAKPGDEVLVCVRTERVQVNPHRPTEHGIDGTVKRIVYRGTDYEATCAFGEQEVRAVVSAVTWDPAIAVGARARIGFNAADVSIFPRAQESEIIQYSTEAV
jgi:spermidine/putrescine transport system ATP-binding protein